MLCLLIFTSSLLAKDNTRLTIKRAWDSKNDPDIIMLRYENRLHFLPSISKTPTPPWSDTYWPNKNGGIAFRWQTNSTPFNYKLKTAQEIAKMPDEELNLLSPAEKYDIAMGNYDYPTVQIERDRTSRHDEDWFGLCHAVAISSSQFLEPTTKKLNVTLPSGEIKKLTFYSSDIKALMAGYINQSFPKSWMAGQRCNEKEFNELIDECWDVNPGSFFILVTNLVGLMKETLIMDVDRNEEVWNSVIWGYNYKLTNKNSISPKAAKGTIKEVIVEMNINHAIGAAPQRTTVGNISKTTTYTFTLELDNKERILGGEWLTKNRPDFIWTTSVPNFSGYYQFINQLL